MTRAQAIKYIMNKNNVSRFVATYYVDTVLKLTD